MNAAQRHGLRFGVSSRCCAPLGWRTNSTRFILGVFWTQNKMHKEGAAIFVLLVPLLSSCRSIEDKAA